MSLELYNARSCRVRDQHRIRARNQDSEIAAEEIRDRGMVFFDSDRRANSRSNSYAYPDSYANSHSHADSYANAHFNSYGGGNGYRYCRAEVYAVAQAAVYATSTLISSSV